MGEQNLGLEKQMSRRGFLRVAAVAAGAKVLASCADTEPITIALRSPETGTSTADAPTTTQAPTTTERETITTSTTTPETIATPATEVPTTAAEIVPSTPEAPGTMLGQMTIPTSEGIITTQYFQADNPYSPENISRPLEDTLIAYIDDGPGLYGGYWGHSFVKPGELGNKVIFGHRTTHTAPFRHIDDIENGAEMLIDYQGQALRYVTLESWVADHPEDGTHPLTAKVLEPVPDQDVITIFACHPEGSVGERFVWRFIRQEF